MDSACSTRAATGGSAVRGFDVSTATILDASADIGEEGRHRPLGAGALGAGGCAIGVELERLPLRTQSIESGRVSSRLSFGQDVRETA